MVAKSRIIALAESRLKHFGQCRRRNLHVTIILGSKGQPIAIGVNRLGANRYCRKLGYTRSIHSEIDALRRLRHMPKRQLRNLTICNVRLSKTGILGFARPCTKCARVIDHLGLKIGFYTERDRTSG